MPFAPSEVWALMTHWPAHARWIPATTIAVRSGPAGVGQRFTARTGVGPLAFDDVMVVSHWQPPAEGVPGVVEVVKEGSVVRGGASFAVATAGPDGGSRVTWTEDVDVAPLAVTRWLSWLIGPPSRLGFAAALRAVERDLRAGRRT